MWIALCLALTMLACDQRPRPDTGEGAQEPSDSSVAGGQRVFANRVAIFMESTEASWDSLRTRYSEEDFQVVMDDLMYYRSVAYEYLEQRGVTVVRLQGRTPLHFVVDGQPRIFDFSAEETLDLVVVYDSGKETLAIAPIAIERAGEYFKLNESR